MKCPAALNRERGLSRVNASSIVRMADYEKIAMKWPVPMGDRSAGHTFHFYLFLGL